MTYTDQMRQEVHALKVPYDFVVDIVEYDPLVAGGKPFYGLRFYESHWRHLNDHERLKCIEYMVKIRNIFKSRGYDTTLDPIFDVKETKWL